MTGFGADKPLPKKHIPRGRPPFERIALLLQGGGALGSYQAGVYEALDEAEILPDWVAGISIGAINSAIICGNAPGTRIEKLREFWHEVTRSPVGIPASEFPLDDISRRVVNEMRAFNIMLFGAPSFFHPRFPMPLPAQPVAFEDLSYYDTAPVARLLEGLVDFERLNEGETRLSVGAVNVTSGNFTYFDTETHTIGVNHILASGALPPGFPAINVDGEYFWDGGIVSNTPLDWVLESQSHDRRDTLAFQVDLWNAKGDLPSSLIEADLRQKEIRFSSRTRFSTSQFRRAQGLRRKLSDFIDSLPEDIRKSEKATEIAKIADHKVYNIIELIYHAKRYEGSSKDYEFSRRTMEEHWATGYNDTIRTLRHPEVLQPPVTDDGFFTFDIAEDSRL